MDGGCSMLLYVCSIVVWYIDTYGWLQRKRAYVTTVG